MMGQRGFGYWCFRLHAITRRGQLRGTGATGEVPWWTSVRPGVAR
jgi:hypothetical protein